MLALIGDWICASETQVTTNMDRVDLGRQWLIKLTLLLRLFQCHRIPPGRPASMVGRLVSDTARRH